MQFNGTRIKTSRENSYKPLIKACIKLSGPIKNPADEKLFGHTQSSDFHPL